MGSPGRGDGGRKEWRIKACWNSGDMWSGAKRDRIGGGYCRRID